MKKKLYRAILIELIKIHDEKVSDEFREIIVSEIMELAAKYHTLNNEGFTEDIRETYGLCDFYSALPI